MPFAWSRTENHAKPEPSMTATMKAVEIRCRGASPSRICRGSAHKKLSDYMEQVFQSKAVFPPFSLRRRAHVGVPIS
jgi:hypothetical protein